MNLILFDTDARTHLLPLTATRPVGALRLGILTLREKWERYLGGQASYISQDYLQAKFPLHVEADNLLLNASIVPGEALCRRILTLSPAEALIYGGELVAARLTADQVRGLTESETTEALNGHPLEESGIDVVQLNRLWQLPQLNGDALEADFKLLTAGRTSQPLPASNRVVGDPARIFLEEGARIEACTINTTTGPVYLGRNAEVMEGSLLRGALAVGDDAIVKLGAKIYGPTTIGPGCRVGGEVTRSILTANSNKAHDGYLGDSVLGEWCNLGADTNNSNLKNNYSEVKLWDYATERFERSGLQFCGLMMGDHAKCGINTMFNTGTVVGVFANVFGAGYPRNFIPDFAWGGADGGYRTYKFSEACVTATAVMSRRQVEFDEQEKAILYHVYDRTAKYRAWEK